MNHIRFRHLLYVVRHRYVSMNVVLAVIAGVIALSWAWASVQVVQKNYALQREVDDKQRQKQLIELETQNLAYQKAYYQSTEYQALQARKLLNVAEPGEKVLVLPPNSAAIKESDANATAPQAQAATVAAEEPSNIQQWADFLFGGRHRAVNDD